jgi:hypothetical protein
VYGLDFLEAHNELIVAGAKFIVRGWKSNEPDIIYEFEAGAYLKTWDDQSQKWNIIAEGGKIPEFLEKVVLGSRYGFKWTYRDFMFALTFWAEGKGK